MVPLTLSMEYERLRPTTASPTGEEHLEEGQAERPSAERTFPEASCAGMRTASGGRADCAVNGGRGSGILGGGICTTQAHPSVAVPTLPLRIRPAFADADVTLLMLLPRERENCRADDAARMGDLRVLSEPRLKLERRRRMRGRQGESVSAVGEATGVDLSSCMSTSLQMGSSKGSLRWDDGVVNGASWNTYTDSIGGASRPDEKNAEYVAIIVVVVHEAKKKSVGEEKQLTGCRRGGKK
ncbi:hypothetical protein FISHEDRAFT_60056 [Fistulina hepatica ATCC 64428]|uniref:Uncharacterized protein n=1 Tax=Fistulina hepatica ATCC 64428 TaxID=1128425 RepID=A0A0D7AA67_9AGAR|nr:hypothetical protein FISHEDRAFT_60056 [Fistulina hepatica ATCC 64428]